MKDLLLLGFAALLLFVSCGDGPADQTTDAREPLTEQAAEKAALTDGGVDKATEDPDVPDQTKIAGTPEKVATPEKSEVIPAEQQGANSAGLKVFKIRHSHTIWDGLLKQYVSADGTVNYTGLKADKHRLKNYVDELVRLPPQADWSKEDNLCYWINMYNAMTVYLLVENFPLKSIKDIDQAWDTPIINVGGVQYTLNQIENSVIRPSYGEPRIHFAVNCGAKSCPKLLNEAFLPEKLETQLEKQTRSFVNSSFNKVSADAVEISKIFEWYAVDFEGYGSIQNFLNRYSKVRINDSAAVSYMEYDWVLNGK